MTSTVRGATAKRSASKVSTYKQSSHTPVGSMARGQLYSSQSEPGMAWQQTMAKSSAPSQRHRSAGGPGRSTYRTEVSKSQYITSVMPQQKAKEVSKSQYITGVMPQHVPAPALNGTGPTRAKSQFLCRPVDVSTTMSKPPVVEFAQTTLKETSG